MTSKKSSQIKYVLPKRMSDTPSNEELLNRLTALEDKVSNSLLMMKRTPDSEYEKLVDVVCDHESKIKGLETHGN